MAGIAAYGTQIAMDTAGTGTFTPLGSVTSITPPETERETIDVTAHDSQDGWKEYVGGLKDAGEVSLEINYDPREHDSLLEQYNSDALVSWKLTWPQSTGSWTFNAFLTGFSAQAPVDDKLSAEITLKASGKPTTAAPAGGTV